MMILPSYSQSRSVGEQSSHVQMRAKKISVPAPTFNIIDQLLPM